MKYSLKLAIAAAFAVSGAAQAADFVLGAPLTPVSTYAEELDYSEATGTAITGIDAVQTTLGFSLTPGDDPIYIRYDLTNAKFAAPVNGTLAGNLADDTAAFGGQALSDSGAVGDSCVLIKVIAATNLQTDVITFNLPDLFVDDTSLPVSIAYNIVGQRAHGTCFQATVDDTNKLTATVSGAALSFDSSLAFAANSPIDGVAQVGASFQNVDSTLGLESGLTQTELALAGLVVAPKAGILDAAGGAVDPDDLFDPANVGFTITGDFSAAGATDVFLVNGTAGTCAGGAGVAPNIATVVGNTATFTGLANLVAPAEFRLCYHSATGAEAFEVANYETSVVLAPVGPVVLAPLAPVASGAITRDGTVLRVPFLESMAGNFTFVNLVNVGTADTTFDTKCYPFTEGAAAAAVPAVTHMDDEPLNGESTKKVFLNQLCPTDGNYKAVDIIVSAPIGRVLGTLARVNPGTGTTGYSDVTGNAIKGVNGQP